MRHTPWSGQALGQTFHVLTCPGCGSFSSNPIPSKAVLDDFYKNEFSYYWYKLYAPGKRRDAAERAAEMAPLLGKRVLDLGGGLGYLAEVLRQKGHETTVYDPYADASVPRPPYGEFDTVVSLHVLEHTPDPLEFLRNTGRFLKPGSRLIFAVPNAAGVGYRERGMDWVWAQPPVLHIHHFTVAGLTDLLLRAGYWNLEFTFHERWDANVQSDLVENGRWDRFFDQMKHIPHVRRYGVWQRSMAKLDVWRRFRQLAKARSSSMPESDRAEILAVATWSPAR